MEQQSAPSLKLMREKREREIVSHSSAVVQRETHKRKLCHYDVMCPQTVRCQRGRLTFHLLGGPWCFIFELPKQLRAEHMLHSETQYSDTCLKHATSFKLYLFQSDHQSVGLHHCVGEIRIAMTLKHLHMITTYACINIPHSGIVHISHYCFLTKLLGGPRL